MNLRDQVGFVDFMRGIWVPFDSATINKVQGLSDVDSNEYRQLFRSPDYDKILKTVVGANASWKIKKDVGLYEIVWFYFMNSRLLPSKHVSTLYKDKAIFLYAILENYKFDVENIIQNSLVEEDVGKSLIPPSLITQLCKDAKVVISRDEERFPSMEPFPFPIEKR